MKLGYRVATVRAVSGGLETDDDGVALYARLTSSAAISTSVQLA